MAFGLKSFFFTPEDNAGNQAVPAVDGTVNLTADKAAIQSTEATPMGKDAELVSLSQSLTGTVEAKSAPAMPTAPAAPTNGFWKSAEHTGGTPIAATKGTDKLFTDVAAPTTIPATETTAEEVPAIVVEAIKPSTTTASQENLVLPAEPDTAVEAPVELTPAPIELKIAADEPVADVEVEAPAQTATSDLHIENTDTHEDLSEKPDLRAENGGGSSEVEKIKGDIEFLDLQLEKLSGQKRKIEEANAADNGQIAELQGKLEGRKTTMEEITKWEGRAKTLKQVREKRLEDLKSILTVEDSEAKDMQDLDRAIGELAA